MHVLFPLLVALALVVYVVTASLAVAIALAAPPILLIAGVAAIAGARSLRLGFELMKAAGASVSHVSSFVGDVWNCFVHPFDNTDEELTDSTFPAFFARVLPGQFIEVHRLQAAVAEAMGETPVQEFWVCPGSEFGVGEARRDGKRFRYLVLGLEGLRALTQAELAAVLAHEFGHLKSGHVWLGRWTRRLCNTMITFGENRSPLNPMFWSTWLTVHALKAAYLPWCRATEMRCDAWAARIVGAPFIISALRKTRDWTPTIRAAQFFVLKRVLEHRQAPTSLASAVNVLSRRIPASERHRLATQDEGDPSDFGGSTHPPTARRIAALHGQKITPVMQCSSELMASSRIDELDVRLTKSWLAPMGVKTFVDVAAFFEAPQQAESKVVEQTYGGNELDFGIDAPPTVANGEQQDDAPLELDLNRDWNKRR